MRFLIESQSIQDRVRGKISNLNIGLSVAIVLLFLIGLIMAFSAFPYNANRIGASSFSLTKKYMFYAAFSIPILMILSNLSQRRIKQVGIIGFFVLVFALCLVPFIGTTIKGGTRWINMGFITLQPSEVLKPFYIIMNALLIVKYKHLRKIGKKRQAKNIAMVSFLLFLFLVALILPQPDLGMTIIYFIIFLAQIFIARFPWKYILISVCFIPFLITTAYFTMPHVNKRINTFLEPNKSDTYQIDAALRVIREAGISGSHSQLLKKNVPDVHTDFILAAVFDSFGIIGGITLLTLIFYIVFKSFKIAKEKLIDDEFAFIVVFSLAVLFMLQSIINISGTLRLIPSKGATLPFVSYGGSSYLCYAIVFGVLLSLTKKYNFE